MASLNTRLTAVYLLILVSSDGAYASTDHYERITISNYSVEHTCGYTYYNLQGERSANTYYNPQGERSEVSPDKIIIKLKSKYLMFYNYSRPYDFHDSRMYIRTDLYDIGVGLDYLDVIPYFKSREEVDIHLSAEKLKLLIKTGNYRVFYPRGAFDQKWVNKFIQYGYYGNELNNVFFYSDLSSKGLESIEKECANLIEERAEARDKPINKFKSFFGRGQYQ